MVTLTLPLRDLVHDRMEMQRLDALTVRELAALVGHIQSTLHAKHIAGAIHAGRLQALLEAQA